MTSIKRHPLNASGDWYVDTSCIDCGAARNVAPGLIVDDGGQSVFARQPESGEEKLSAWRARLLCPTASVRTEHHAEPPAGVFPEEMTAGIFRLGYNSRASFGAHSYAVRRAAGNFMVDSPRWTKAVVTALEEVGGLADILLTHRDDVADADRYAEHFGARVWIHDWDRNAAPYATDIIEGVQPRRLGSDLIAIPVPGHTKGSVVYLYEERCLFTGDSLAWSFEDDDLEAFRGACWYSWEEQTKSLRRLSDYKFEWVLAGHGGSHHVPVEEMRARLEALVLRMAED
jgi:glyoxylase-like metal-dependent hydrolase (beta-lactamase superfamily II)